MAACEFIHPAGYKRSACVAAFEDAIFGKLRMSPRIGAIENGARFLG